MSLTVQENIASLSLAEKVGQLFVIGIAGPEIDPATRELLDEIKPGGVCLFARNIKSLDQTRQLLDSIRDISAVTPMLSVDEEGGLVDRLRRVMAPTPAANKLRFASDAGEQAGRIGEALSLLGFNTDFAPVVDVVDAERGKYSNGLFSRAYGGSREDAAEFAGEFLKELQKHGIIGCVKHFPGLGASSVDSHEELPIVEISEAELEQVDLYPYRRLIGKADLYLTMVGHVAFPNHSMQQYDAEGRPLPASLSYNFVTRLLRDALGFDGAAITDDLEMGAIVRNYGIGDACKLAIEAGNDLLAICADPENIRKGFRSVLGAVERGEISRERIDVSLDRIARLKVNFTEPPIFDTKRLEELSVETAAFAARFS